HVQEGELPRTPTRKVRRGEVATLLAALEADRAPRATTQVVPSAVEWLERIVAPLVGCRPRDLRPGASLDQLGLDSLGYVDLVAANHLSHLDAGLVRLALGASGDRLFVLAAADYFFDTPLKRAFFSSFAGLLPLERGATTADSLRRAVETLENGFSVLVFPEGTRSRSGALQEFHRGVGHLALRARVGVLPMRVDTHRALPPGSLTLKSRKVDARIGPFLGYEVLARRAAGRTRAEAEREV